MDNCPGLRQKVREIAAPVKPEFQRKYACRTRIRGR